MAEQYGFSKPRKQYTGILIQQIPGSSYSILQYTANPVSNHRPMPGTNKYRVCSSGACASWGNYLYPILNCWFKVPAFEPLARGRVKKIILSQSSQT
jgi:hypothetical protein